ncbi:hypothetical protein JT358_06650 [Micrococcales bacterium 31B]|nr:hypothetical protein [Micrococcales bacterium 31B]
MRVPSPREIETKFHAPSKPQRRRHLLRASVHSGFVPHLDRVVVASVTTDENEFQHVRVSVRPHPQEGHSFALQLDEVRHLIDAAREAGDVIDIALHHPAAQALALTQFPLEVHTERLPATHRDISALARHLCQQRMHQLRVRRPLRVATDASLQTGSHGVGIACVSENGRYRSSYLESANDILLGELHAIELALRTWENESALVIQTDSFTSVSRIRQARTCGLAASRGWSAPVEAVVRDIVSLCEGRVVRIEWVRGHSGDPLNDTADRLAVARRRTQRSRLTMHEANRIYKGIIEDLRDAADAVAESAESALARS